MDYSLLLGIDDDTQEIVLGILGKWRSGLSVSLYHYIITLIPTTQTIFGRSHGTRN